MYDRLHLNIAENEQQQRLSAREDLSGCTGEGWQTAGSAEADSWRKRQLAKQKESQMSYKRQPIVQRNRFDIPSDSDSDEEEQSRGSGAAGARS